MPDARGLVTDAEQRAAEAWLEEIEREIDRAEGALGRLKVLAHRSTFRGDAPDILKDPWTLLSAASNALHGCWEGPQRPPTPEEVRDWRADEASAEERGK